MIFEIISMNGYGVYVWLAFIFTLINFVVLYSIINLHLKKEERKFQLKFANLTPKKTKSAKMQNTYKEILANTSTSNI